MENPENLKNLVPGNCKFPFKYRRKDVITCQQKKDGKWCATSTDKEGNMKTWGFCQVNKLELKLRNALLVRN